MLIRSSTEHNKLFENLQHLYPYAPAQTKEKNTFMLMNDIVKSWKD